MYRPLKFRAIETKTAHGTITSIDGALALIFGLHQTIRERPYWREATAALKRAERTRLPADVTEAYQAFTRALTKDGLA